MTELRDVIRKSVGLPPSSVTDVAIAVELADFKKQLASVTDQLRRRDGTIDVERIFELPQKIDDLAERLGYVESYMPREFTEKDVFEVNKRIERLEAKVALISSYFFNSRAIQFCLRFFNG
jgi:hypothetical protein